MSTEFPDPSAPGPVDTGLPGQQLKAARESMGYSVEQIADQLKLHPRQVRALEEGDYAALPPSAVTRGFVRMYAKAVRLDAAPLVAKLPTDAAAAAADTSLQMRGLKPASFTESRYPSNGKRRGFPLVPVIGAVVIVAAAAAAWHFGVGGLRSGAGTPPQASSEASVPLVPPASQNPAATTPGTVTAPAASPAANADGTLNPSVPLISVPPPANGTPPANAAPPASAPATGTAPQGTAPATPPAGAAQTAPAPAAGTPPTRTAATVTASPAPSGNALVLHVTADSWIQVKPESGAPLLSRLVKAGSTETVDLTGPVTVTVGNPAGVDATLRGAAVALPPVPGKTIARVNLK